MGVISYTAQRDVASDHVAGTDYDLEIYFSNWQPRQKVEKTRHVALSGRSETYRQRTDKFIDITLDRAERYAVSPSQLDYIREFISSVDGGEPFSIDMLGSIAAPDTPGLYEMITDSFTEAPVGANYVEISFSVRAI